MSVSRSDSWWASVADADDSTWTDALPAYGKGALSDLLPSVAAAMGVPAFRDVLGVANAAGVEPGELRRVCVLLVDALGWRLLRRLADRVPELAGMAGRMVTAGFPATTATSICSVGTGLAPGAHGVVGYTVAIPGTDRKLNSLRWDPEIDPLRWQPYPTVFAAARAEGIEIRHVGRHEHAGGGLTAMATAPAEYRPADVMGDLAAEAIAATASAAADAAAGSTAAVAGATAAGAGRTLTYAYHGDLDAVGHVRGCGSAAFEAQLAHVELLVKTLVAGLPSDAILLVTGDHGMIDVPMSGRIDVRDQPELLAGVRLLAGDPRARYVYARPGAEADVLAAWRTVLGERARVVSRAEAVEAGWFGPDVRADVLPRIGDVVVSCDAATAVIDREREPIEARLVGLHGGMEPDELLVPLLIARGQGEQGARSADRGRRG